MMWPAGERCNLHVALGIVIATVVGLTPSRAGAQVVQGQVVDSRTQLPVAGATITLVMPDGASEVAEGDAEGRFLLSAPPFSQVHLRLVHPGYLPAEFPPFSLARGDTVRFRLLMPPAPESDASPLSAPEIIQLLCPDGVPDPLPIMAGIVRDDATGEPVPNAVVRVFADAIPTVLRSLVPGDRRPVDLRADQEGVYAICGAPLATRLEIRASLGKQSGPFEAFMFFEGRVSDGRATHPLPTRLFEHDLPLRSAESNTAALRGTVVDSVGLPLSGVQVDVVGWDLTARTDVAGTFTLVGLPPGTPSVRFRKLGLQQADVVVTLWASGTTNLAPGAVVLDDLPTTLADLIVWGEAPSRNPYMAGFFKRKRSAARGNQITLREFTERYGRPFFTSSVLRRLSGIMGISRLTFSRCGSVPPAIYLDRMYVGNGVNPGVDDLLPVEWLGAVETYPRNAAPFELGLQDRPGTCGSIYLWTER